MTVSSATNKSGPYSGNGVATVFAYGFRILDATHIQVVTTTGGTDTIVSASAYSVSGVGNASGGNVTFTTAPATGTTINLIRNAPFTQGVDLENQGAYYAETVEEAFDLAAMRDQQLQEQINRSVKIPVGEDASTLDTLIEDIVRLNDSAANIDTVAGISANVTTVAGISANVTTVAGIAPNVTTVAGVAADVPTVAGISANVTTVAGVAADVPTVAGISADVTTVGGISANVTTVAGISAAVSTVATNVADVTNFADVYLGPAASNPTLRTDGTALQTGDLFFNTTADQMRVWDGAAWIAASSALNGTTRRQSFTATAGQTTFTVTGGYDAGFADVYLNGVKLVNGTDVTVTSGTDVVLAVGATAGDSVDVVAYGTFEVANTYTQAETDGFLAAKASLTGVETLTNKTLTSLNGGPLAGFRNAIINGNFDHWQRDTIRLTFGPGSYLADRWVLSVSLTGGSVTQSRQAFTVGQTDVPNEPTYFYRVAGSSAASAFFNVAQKIEDVRTFAGESVTVSFYAKASTARNIRPRFLQLFDGSANVETAASPVSLTTSWQKFTATVSIPSIAGKMVGANSRLELTFDIKEGVFGSDLGSDSIDIAQVQLEAGSVATPFERRPVGTELALCQRYYEKSDGGQGSAVFFAGNVTNTATYFAAKGFAVQKRATPTLAVTSTALNGFPSTTLGEADRSGFRASGTANANANGAFFIAQWTADAEL